MIVERRAALGAKLTEFKSHKKHIQKKLLISAGLGAAMVGITWGGLPYLALREGTALSKFLPGSSINGLALGVSYGIQTAASFINLNQERRILENQKIGISQNFGATATFYGLEKVKPLKKKERRSIAAVVVPSLVSYAWSIPREMTLVSLALLSPDKMQELAVLKSTHALFSLSQAGAAEIALRTIGKEKKTETADLKKPVWKTIFRRPPRPVPVSVQEG